jgi:hypothetical protein
LVLVPDAAANPAVALVVELSHVYVYVPLPPVGVDPLMEPGVLPVQMDCAPDAVLPATGVVTVMAMANEVSLAGPDVT